MSQRERIGVVGAGLMGRGIAYVFALAGHEVALCDVSGEILERSIEWIRAETGNAVDRGSLAAAAGEAVLARIETTTALETLAQGRDLIVEAAPEDLELKKGVFAQLDELARESATLATNTSALSITEIGAATARPGRVVGLHFFNPAHRMPLVEVVRGLETEEATVERVERICRAAGKETVRVNDFPGFATSRISALIGNEAFHMLTEGVASAAEIDKAVKLGLNHPMGPFELGDLVGLDTRLRVLEHLHRTLGERFRPSPLLVRYVRAGRLGCKTGKGVYRYDPTGRRLDP